MISGLAQLRAKSNNLLKIVFLGVVADKTTKLWMKDSLMICQKSNGRVFLVVFCEKKNQYTLIRKNAFGENSIKSLKYFQASYFNGFMSVWGLFMKGWLKQKSLSFMLKKFIKNL